MKKLLLSCLTMLLSVVMVSAEEVTFDFVNETYGLTRLSGNTSEYAAEGTVLTENGGITITLNNNLSDATNASGVRLWGDGLRFYKGGTMTIAAPEGKHISNVTMTGKKATGTPANIGTSADASSNITDGTWSGEANSVKFYYTATSSNQAIGSMTITLEEGEAEGGEEPGTGGDGGDGGDTTDPETPSVETLTDFIAAAPTVDTKITGTVTVYYQSPDKRYTFITDGTSNLMVYGSLSNVYNNGDQLTGIVGTLTEYNGMLELIPNTSSFGTATAGTAIQPKSATLTAEINNCDFITLSGISISGISGKNCTLSDGTNTYAGYNQFGITISEVENATVVAIGGTYKTNKQLYIVSVTTDGEGGGEEPDPVDPNAKGQKDNPYTVEEVIALNNPGTTGQWVTGYIIGVINYDNNSQLEVGASTTVRTCLAIASTPDETDKANCVAVQLPNNAIRTALNLVDNPGNVGKQVSVCGSLEKYFGMAGVKSLTDYVLGEGGEDGGEEPDPVDPNAKGQENNPYTVEEAIALGNPGTTAQWVTGYIVGVLNSNNNYTFETTAPFAVATSIMIASSPTETDQTKCFPVQLPAGKIREDLNLVDRPGNLGREVSVCGDLVAYFNMPGMKNTSNYTIVGGLAPIPVAETESLTTFVEEQFSSNTKITGTVTVYYQSPDKKYTFITDGTTNLEVYAGGGLEYSYVNGDQLTGIIGKFSYYQNMPQLTPQVDSFGEPTPGTAIQPVETTLSTVQPADYVMIKNATITSTTADNKTTITVSDASGSRILFDRFAIGVTDATNVNILGIGAVFGEDAQLFPIEITPVTDGINEITTDNNTVEIYDLQGRKLNAPVRGINIINGRKVLVR